MGRKGVGGVFNLSLFVDGGLRQWDRNPRIEEFGDGSMFRCYGTG